MGNHYRIINIYIYIYKHQYEREQILIIFFHGHAKRPLKRNIKINITSQQKSYHKIAMTTHSHRNISLNIWMAMT